MWLCMKRLGAWLYGVHNMHQDSCSFTWHQPCQHCTYTTSVDIKKLKHYNLYKASHSSSHVEPNVSRVSLLKKAKNSAI